MAFDDNHPSAPSFAANVMLTDGTIDVQEVEGATATYARASTALVWDGWADKWRFCPAESGAIDFGIASRIHGARMVHNQAEPESLFQDVGATSTDNGDGTVTITGLSGASTLVSVETSNATMSLHASQHNGDSGVCALSVITVRGSGGDIGLETSWQGVDTDLMLVTLTSDWRTYALLHKFDSGAGNTCRLEIQGVIGGASSVDVKDWAIFDVTGWISDATNSAWDGIPSQNRSVNGNPAGIESDHGTRSVFWHWKTPGHYIDSSDANITAPSVVGIYGRVIDYTDDQAPLHPGRSIDNSLYLIADDDVPTAVRGATYAVGDQVYPDGLRPYADDSAQLVTNGDFETGSDGSTPTGWTQVSSSGGTFKKQTPGSSGIGEAISSSGDGGIGRQDVTVTVGQKYAVYGTAFEGNDPGQFKIDIGSTTGGTDLFTFTSAGGAPAGKLKVVRFEFVATTTTVSITLSEVGLGEGASAQFDDFFVHPVKDQLSVYLECTAIGTGIAHASNTINGSAWPDTNPVVIDTTTITDGGVTWTIKGRHARQGFMGYQAEGARTNDIDVNSDDPENWTTTVGTPTFEDGVGFDGITTGRRVSDLDGAASNYPNYTEVGVGGGTFWTYSVFLKKEVQSDDYPMIALNSPTDNDHITFINKQTGALADEAGFADGNSYILDMGDWWRVYITEQFTFTVDITADLSPANSVDFATSSTAAAGSATFWAPMLEEAYGPSSPIINDGTSNIMRLADDLNYGSGNFNLARGFMQFTAVRHGLADDASVPSYINANNNPIVYRKDGEIVNTALRAFVTGSTVLSASYPQDVPVNGHHEASRIQYHYSDDDYVTGTAVQKLFANGVLLDTDTFNGLTDEVLDVGGTSGTNELYGLVGAILIWPDDLTMTPPPDPEMGCAVTAPLTGFFEVEIGKMYLRPLTAGKVSSTGTLNLNNHPTAGGSFGGALITTDGTNIATIVIRADDGSGEVVFEIATKVPGGFFAPIKAANNTNTYHYSVTGTGAEAQFYEWMY